MSATLAALAATMPLMASHAYAEGAPPGFSGGFTEQSCQACHFDAEPNAGPGRVVIDGAPARFTPGERYTLTITLTHAGMTRAGFQLTARFKDTGAQAGALAPGNDEGDRVGVETSGDVQYVDQKVAGAAVRDGTSRWTVTWTAPETGGAVTFHVAANAANGNESADGDLVYTASAESVPPP